MVGEVAGDHGTCPWPGDAGWVGGGARRICAAAAKRQTIVAKLPLLLRMHSQQVSHAMLTAFNYVELHLMWCVCLVVSTCAHTYSYVLHAFEFLVLEK